MKPINLTDHQISMMATAIVGMLSQYHERKGEKLPHDLKRKVGWKATEYLESKKVDAFQQEKDDELLEGYSFTETETGSLTFFLPYMEDGNEVRCQPLDLIVSECGLARLDATSKRQKFKFKFMDYEGFTDKTVEFQGSGTGFGVNWGGEFSESYVDLRLGHLAPFRGWQ